MTDPQRPPDEVSLAAGNTAALASADGPADADPSGVTPDAGGGDGGVDADHEADAITEDAATPLWRNSAFLAVWSASTISIFGSLITRTALPLAAIFVLSAGPVEIAALRSSEQIAGLIVGLMAGAWVDRLRRRPIMIWADVGRAILLFTIPIAALAGGLTLWHLVIVAFAAAVLSTFFDVADNAYLPTVVSRRRLIEANSALTATGSVAEFSAFGIGGYLVQLFTAPIAIAVDAVSFVVSAILLGTIRRKEPPPKPAVDREPVLREIRDGIRIVARSPLLRALALSHGGTHVLWGIFGTSYLLYALNDLKLEAGPIGLIAAIGGIGSLAGSALAPRIVRRFGIGQAILLGIAGFTIGNALIPLAPSGTIEGLEPSSVILLGALFLVVQQLFGDALATVYEVTETSLIQASVPNRLLGRVNASVWTFTTLMTLVGAVAGGIIAEVWGLRASFWIGLSGAVFAFLAVWFSPVRHVRDTPNAPLVGGDMPLTE